MDGPAVESSAVAEPAVAGPAVGKPAVVESAEAEFAAVVPFAAAAAARFGQLRQTESWQLFYVQNPYVLQLNNTNNI